VILIVAQIYVRLRPPKVLSENLPPVGELAE
jgi:hypothetical protein